MIIVNVLEPTDKRWIFGRKCLSTESTKYIADEVSDECTDGQGENNTNETETSGREDGSEGDSRNRENHVESSDYSNHKYTEVSKRGDLCLKIWVVKEIFGGEQGE